MTAPVKHSEKRQKTAQVLVRLTPEDFAELRRQADLLDLTPQKVLVAGWRSMFREAQSVQAHTAIRKDGSESGRGVVS